MKIVQVNASIQEKSEIEFITDIDPLKHTMRTFKIYKTFCKEESYFKWKPTHFLEAALRSRRFLNRGVDKNAFEDHLAVGLMDFL